MLSSLRWALFFKLFSVVKKTEDIISVRKKISKVSDRWSVSVKTENVHSLPFLVISSIRFTRCQAKLAWLISYEKLWSYKFSPHFTLLGFLQYEFHARAGSLKHSGSNYCNSINNTTGLPIQRNGPRYPSTPTASTFSSAWVQFCSFRMMVLYLKKKGEGKRWSYQRITHHTEKVSAKI